MRRDRLHRLSKLLPLVVMFSHGLPDRVAALELSASGVATLIADALRQGHLDIAQAAVHQLTGCNVRALNVDGVEYSVTQLNLIISALARGESVSLMPAPASTATFLIEPNNLVSSYCATPAQEQQVFPTGSAGAPV